MKKRTWAIHFAVILLFAAGLVLLTHRFDPLIFNEIKRLTGRRVQETWPQWINLAAWGDLVFAAAAWLWWIFVRPNAEQIGKKLRQAGVRWETFITRLIPLPDCPARPYRFSWLDGLILAVFLLFGAVLFLEKIQGPYPFVRLGSDAGNIASFAAALAYPDRFAQDPLLSDPANLRSYSTLNILILNLLERLAGNYSLAFAWIIPIQAFVNLAGFYLLGMALFKNRFWAALFAILCAAPYEMNMNETWGITLDPVTRFTFQALLPYLLVLILKWHGKPRLWPVLMVLTGLMAFVHPVSTPGWAVGIWLGMLACLPAAWGAGKKTWTMLGLAAVLALSLTPYAMAYLGTFGQPRAPLSAELAIRVINTSFPGDMLNVPGNVKEFVSLLARSGLLPVGLVGLLVLVLLPWRDRSRVALVFLWLVGLVAVSTLVPWVEHGIEYRLRVAPLEIDLIRGLRYGVFFLLLFATWALAELHRRLEGSPWRFAPAAAGLLLAIGWLAVSDGKLILPRRLVDCLGQGRLVCIQTTDGDAAIQALQERTPPGAPIFATFSDKLEMTFALPVRYLALRPLVYSFKDRGQLVTARSAALETWYPRRLEMASINEAKLPTDTRMDHYASLADAWGAVYLMADFKCSPALIQQKGWQVVYENPGYILLKLH